MPYQLTTRRLLRVTLFVLLYLSLLPVAFADTSVLPLTLEQLNLTRTTINRDTSLDQEQKEKTFELLDQADNWLQQANKIEREITRLEKLIKEAPQRIQDLRGDINRITDIDESLDAFIESSNLASLELRISKEELNLVQARDEQKTC
jgi:septal ring factor EnvC (AmiA/AmiB activator)